MLTLLVNMREPTQLDGELNSAGKEKNRIVRRMPCNYMGRWVELGYLERVVLSTPSPVLNYIYNFSTTGTSKRFHGAIG